MRIDLAEVIKEFSVQELLEAVFAADPPLLSEQDVNRVNLTT